MSEEKRVTWESTVRSASPAALREVGDRCARSVDQVRMESGHCPPRRFWSVILALQSGEPEAALKAMRRVAPEFRAPILYALNVEATLEGLSS